MTKWVGVLILITFILSGSSYGQGQQKAQDPGDLYDAGMALFHKAKYEEAIDRFSKLILFFPASKLSSYSRYMIGQCYLKMRKYEEALQQFELYLKAFPDGDRIYEAKKGIEFSKEKLREKASPPALSPQPVAPDEPKKKSDEVKLLTPQLQAWNSPKGDPFDLLRASPEHRIVLPVKGESSDSIERIETSPSNRKVKRRICAQVFDLDFATLEEVEREVKVLKEVGVDTLILRVFQNKGGRPFKFVTPRHEEGVYFETRHALVVDDVLGKMAEIVHRNGLDLFAWITTRYANYGLEEPSEYRCKSYNFETKKIEVARGFNLFHPVVLKRLEGLFRDLGRYPIEGILLQDDLILKHNEDFSAEANQAFLKEFGYSPHPNFLYVEPFKSDSGKYYVKSYTQQFWTWANWKNRWLMNVAQRLMRAARESNPNLKFGINLYCETVLNSSNAVAWFSQTFSEALGKNFDYYALMTYHRQTMRELNMEERKAIGLMAEVARNAVTWLRDPSQVLMKIQIFDWKSLEVVPQKEVEDVVTGILNHGEVSLAFVPYMNQFALQALKGKWVPSK
jgi:biofilm PGA synthesis lipoprotein PgaB